MIWSARWPCWARRKIFTSLVCAGRSSVASYLTYALRHLDRKAFLIDGLGGMFTEQLSLVGPKDVVWR